MGIQKTKIWRIHKRGICRDTKKVMFTYRVARRIVKDSLESRDPKRKECRTYYCASCDSYHTTSVSKENYIDLDGSSNIVNNLIHIDKWTEILKRQNEETKYYEER